MSITGGGGLQDQRDPQFKFWRQFAIHIIHQPEFLAEGFGKWE